ncbi:MAG TPA: hypothetical protein VN615_14100, partial [Gaiellales bacterium]|nr:hypothetical protein [Gaiellales bacterium]
MSTPLAALLFLISLAATLAASGLFARRLDALGVRLGIPEALLGLLTALAADGPELSSGLTAMIRGENGVGVGVLVGSNLFNLAAMVGLSALLAGSVRLGIPEALLGLLTALAADGPELSSGLTAMVRGENGVGIGVLVGSNLFNLAAMVGLSALVAGSVRLDRPALTLEGAFALFVIAVAAGVLF